jgi:predicted nucleic acid-binding protein
VIDAFDADVLIYAALDSHPVGDKIRRLLRNTLADAAEPTAVGSVLLLPEVLSKPMRLNDRGELLRLAAILGRIHLRPTDPATARVATVLASSYRLRAADAVHLATAVIAGADRFITNNKKDFPPSITEVDVTYPDDL